MIEALRRALADDSRIAYAVQFGSTVRGTSHAHSDVDVAVGTTAGQVLDVFALGEITRDSRRLLGALSTWCS